MKRKCLLVCLAFFAALGVSAQDTQLLVFSKTAGFRHNSIPAGVGALKKMGEEQGFRVTATEDASVFTDEGLASYDAVVFLNTTGDILDGEQQAAFERYIRAGHGFVGIHAATDTEYEWPWYGKLVGAWFKSHPPTVEGKLTVTDRRHVSTRGMPREFMHTDEWYDFRKNPGPSDVRILVTIDETSYDHGDDQDHPVSWCHEFDGGRAFYTLMGHRPETFSNATFLKHLSGGIRWVLR